MTEAAPPRPNDNIRDWLLAVLRFAVTLEEADRAAVLSAAAAMDRCGSSEFSFFVKTSTELCAAIADKNDPRRNAVIKRHIARIDDRRLRRAFEAAIDWMRAAKTVSRPDPYRRSDLWQGLTP